MSGIKTEKSSFRNSFPFLLPLFSFATKNKKWKKKNLNLWI